MFSYAERDDVPFTGPFESIEACLADARKRFGSEVDEIFIGENKSPTQPEDLWEAEDWLEHVSCQDDYSGESAEDWDCSTKSQREELETAVRKVMAEWLDKHKLRPMHWMVENIQAHSLAEPIA